MIARLVLALIALIVCTPAAAQTVLPSATPEIQAYPAGFNWVGPVRPTIYRAPNGRYMTDLDPKTVPGIASIFATGVPYYVDPAAADNSGNGTSVSTPKQGLRAAIIACETANPSGSCIYYVNCSTNNVVDRSRDFTGSSGNQGAMGSPARPTAIVFYGAKDGQTCSVGAFALGLSWSLDGTYTSTYKATRSSLGWALDRALLDRNGIPTPYVAQASAAAVDACSGLDCMYSDGTTIYLKRADGRAPTDANTFIVLISNNLYLGTADFYLSGGVFFGGTSAVLQATAAATRNIVLADATFVYPAAYSNTAANTLAFDNMTGFAGLFRISGGYSQADFVNPHEANNVGTSPQLTLLAVDLNCFGTLGKAQSSNCWTQHEYVQAITLNSHNTSASGGSNRNIGNSSQWALGDVDDADRGDIAAGGSYLSTGFGAENSAQIWCQDCRSTRNLRALSVGGGAAFYARRFEDGGGLRTGAGTIGGF